MTERCIDLSGEKPFSPELRVWSDEANITLTVGALHGEQKRFVEMTPTEAREVAAALLLVAAEVEGFKK